MADLSFLCSFSSSNLELVLGYSDPVVVPPDPVVNTFPFWGSGESFLPGAIMCELIVVDPALALDSSRRLDAIPWLQLLGGDFRFLLGKSGPVRLGWMVSNKVSRQWPEDRIRELVIGLTIPSC